jgi:iron complex outermembrane receptor protein
MNSLYSPGSGNPDLRSEFASTWELGASYNKGFYLTGSIFITKLKDMINSFRLPSGLRTYFNIGEARLNGAEIQFQQSSNWLNVTANYTYLDHKNISDNRPLDVLPNHNLNFVLDFSPFRNFNFAIFGLLASKSDWYDSNARKLITIPRYRSLDVILSHSLSHFAPFIKVSNMLNDYFYTEPGFPWRGRYIEIGIKADLF